ncbi:hypothetical protein K504DRAFT_533725 [Pleomassaria siparia CBS 279.74]|uniref:AAA+ ATPase domain-containing protein n=1 Tax=Pleomassaria siparia CBS 279.74 TaxID=1314801 RepID=A0A6G1K8Y2_9PLEO|nr:hypothetical protein K504DRAFT_533725 [Pleomassaria siparia CBS 279.74]
MLPQGTGLAITNPLILYRSLIATNRIKPDPAQHRLALHLEKIYNKLIDYEPSIEYSQRLRQLNRIVGPEDAAPEASLFGTKGIWTSLLAQKEKRDSLALTRVLTDHEAAMNLQSPQGLMLHGEVGTGKSMLIDLFADCLPNQKKRRCHFNTFMLDATSRLEQLRKAKLVGGSPSMQEEYSLLWLARDLVQKSPILFLDEFQLPDRVASKILSNLMTSFFQLGGVLIATSNRMPEELAKAAGMDFARPVSRVSRLGWTLGLGGRLGVDDGPGQLGEFAKFLEVLRARCELWEMEGKADYRRLSGEEDGLKSGSTQETTMGSVSRPSNAISSGTNTDDSKSPTPATDSDSLASTALPKQYFISSSSSSADEFNTALSTATSTPHPIPWTPTTLTVYGRPIPIPATHKGCALFTFAQICGAVLGPADYITLASTYHTFIITEVPILTFHQKNEARRFITLLDALYEARCRLLVSAAAGIDDIFFPEPRGSRTPGQTAQDKSAFPTCNDGDADGDATHPETYSEIHQDLTAPFRPNISPYSASAKLLPPDALEDDPPNRVRRPGSSSDIIYDDDKRTGVTKTKALDFANIRGLTGEDEVFAVKRAQSRVWEMCSGKWWRRGCSSEGGGGGGGEAGEETSWWRPLPLDARHWERGADVESSYPSSSSSSSSSFPGNQESDVQMVRDAAVDVEYDIERKGTSSDAPPKISWTHIWGTTKWGKKAGAWGKGVEGLEERRKVKDGEEEEEEEVDIRDTKASGKR